MAAYESAPLLSEAYQEYIQKRDPIFAAPRSFWELVHDVAQRASEDGRQRREMDWSYPFQIAAANGFRRIKAILYLLEFLFPLMKGEKVAVGQVVPRHQESQFSKIDRAIWHEGQVDVKKSWVRADDITFAGVRIPNEPCEDVRLANEAMPTPSTDKPRQKPGPKSAAKAVYAAVDQLYPDPGFRNALRIRQLDMVLALIRGKDSALDALLARAKEKTLKEHIGTRVHELAAQKGDHG